MVSSKRKIDENSQPRKKIKEETPSRKNSKAILLDLTDSNSPIKSNKTSAKEIPTKVDTIPSQKVVLYTYHSFCSLYYLSNRNIILDSNELVICNK